MKHKLIKILNEIVDLLKECNWQNKASWFEEKLIIIESCNVDSKEFISSIKAIKSILAGMGSFTDLPMIPVNDSKLSKEEARKKQFDLAKMLDVVVIKLLEGRGQQ